MQCVWVLLIFLPAALSLSQKFKVEGPDAPVVGVSGFDVVLPCSVRELEPPNIMMNATDLNVTWSRSDLRDSKVHLYQNYKDINTDQNPSYRGRTAVFKEELQDGNVSLKISNVQISDQGVYRCRVDSKSWFDEHSVHLSVEVIGSKPVITVEKYESGKFSLLCESNDWRPEPDLLQWRNSKGDNLTAETENQTAADFWFNMKSRITVEEIDSFYCRVTWRNYVTEGEIHADTLYKHVPNPWKIRGIIIGVTVLVVIVAAVVIYRIRKRRKEIRNVTSLLISGRDACLQHHDLSDRQWDHVVKMLLNSVGDERLQHQNLSDRQSDHPEETLLKPKEERKEFNLRKYDPSDRGVQKLQRVIAATTHIQLVDCNLSEISCAALAEVLRSNNSLIELNLSQNRLKDTGVKILCDGLKNKNCKLQILRLENCTLSEISCEYLASVLQSENSTLIELNLSQNKELKYSGVKILCDGLKSKNNLEKLSLEDCDLTEISCKLLAEVLQSENSKLIELNLSQNKLQDAGVKKLCGGLKSKNFKLQILRLENCDLRVESCNLLAKVLKSKNSTLIELNLNKNNLQDSGVQILCNGLKNNNKLQILRLADCDIREEGCKYIKEALQQNPSSPLKELDLSGNGISDSGKKLLSELKAEVNLDSQWVLGEVLAKILDGV